MIRRIMNRDSRMPPAAQSVLDKHGDKRIVSMTIYRAPISQMIQGFLSTVSKVPFDKLFHLRLYVQLQGGTTVVLEKNERLNISTVFSYQKDSETMNVTEPVNMTLAELIQRTQQRMGAKFYTYSSSSNNCQYFVDALLRSAGVMNQKYFSFVKQSTESIFKDRPILRRLANSVTGTAALANAAFQGGELRPLSSRLDAFRRQQYNR